MEGNKETWSVGEEVIKRRVMSEEMKDGPVSSVAKKMWF